MLRIAKVLSLTAIGMLVLFGPSVFAAQNQFTVHVPQRTNPNNVDQYPIMKLKVTVYIDTSSPVTFSIQDPWGDSPVSIGPLQPVNPVVPSSLTFFPAPAGRNASSVRIWPPDSSLASTDPNFGKYVLLFNLDSDFQLGVSCTGTMTSTEDWTISVSPGPHIARGCAQSLNTSITDNSCTGALGTVPRTGELASITGLTGSALGCRPGVDTILVLDKSGSMSDSDLAMVSQPKINALRTSVQTLATTWDALRTAESSAGGIPQIVSPADQVGVVLFDTSVNWWSALGSGLKSFETVKSTLESMSSLNTITPGTRTNIGGGLLLADPEFSGGGGASGKPENRHVVLLMTDGIQNEGQGVGVDNSVAGKIVTYPINNPSAATALPNKTKYQLYVTSVGVSSAVDPTHIFPMGQVDGDNYKNAETDSAQLPTFFTEMLQNFLQFSTQETVRVIADTVTSALPFKPAKGFKITTTSASAVFSLSWNAALASTLRLTVFPPGGAAPVVKDGTGGSLALTVMLPPRPSYDPKGDWQLQIEIPPVIINDAAPSRPSPQLLTPVAFPLRAPETAETAGAFQPPPTVPFQLVVLSDDLGVNSKLQVLRADYGPGDPIKLQVKLTEFGEPVTGSSVIAMLVKPGKSIGDLLSESSASADPTGADPDTPANTKLKNALKANPGLLVRNSDTVTLFDDGKPEHGDAKAGDGIYSALYPSQLPGHYNFVFLAEGNTQRSGRFSRMQVNTAYVSPVPDKVNTQVQSNTTTTGTGNTLTINMTPKTKIGDKMGPGWANYFWFTAPGVTPFKAKDNLNGTYTATLPFTGGTPPQVKIHFLRVPLFISDAVTPDHLPVPLGDGNTLTQVGSGNASRFAVFADLGVGIPHGTFANVANAGVSFNAGFEYILKPNFSAEGILGVHHFPGKIGGSVTAVQFGGGGKVFIPIPGSSNRVFARAGIAAYHFTSGTTNFGGYFGPGFLHEFNPHFGVEAAYTFHAVNTPGNATQFSSIQGGVRYAF